ncbi:Tc toxin subunit A [Xenorhabdus sp. XENO-7]|uniref:Tc toxin subunit A n=1 Tax=Xenorhabdus aichiensis TaxID=3025874 RepID=A0ABT5M2A3_9GAMM|nr:Tc toxin subunit A [Xenorhabdus aichiensis]MDC9621818.1 Tc toxin subunit A [Xenorhabdus aichiensis]
MNQPTSPLISRTEAIYNLPGKLTSLGYTSVFDVVRIPRERFIRQHRAALGRSAEKMYDLAVGYAHQVRHHFRYNPLSRAVQVSLRSPFSVSGPDYSNQFLDANTGWKDKAPSGSPEANDAPVAYLTHIYQLALEQEKSGASAIMNTLAERRPDIGTLLINDKAINEVIPQLQLVNEILSKAIQKKLSLTDLEAVNAKLSTTRYPNNLPYHYGHQQIQTAQSVLGTTLQDITLPQTLDLPQNFWATAAGKLSNATAGALTRLQIMASQLSPEQQKIITETVGKDFYQLNYGDSSLTVNSFSDMTVLTGRTNLIVPQVEQMLCSTVGDSTVIKSGNVSAGDMIAIPFAYGARFIHAGKPETITLSRSGEEAYFALTVNNLTNDKLDRINRMVRLQKWLNLPYEDIDLLVTSAMDAETVNTELLMNDNTLRMLGVFKHYQAKYGVTAKQFAGWLRVVAPFAITPAPPFLDQVFNSVGTFDTPFVIDNQDFVYTLTTGGDGACVKHISTALGLNHRQFLLLADNITRQQGNVTLSTLNCNLFVVSAFYRLANLARTLGINPEAFCALADRLDAGTGIVWQQLAGKPTITAPKKDSPLAADILSLLQALSMLAQWGGQHDLPFSTQQLLLSDERSVALPEAGSYGTISDPGQMERVSIGWKDLTYDAKSGELTLTQQIAFRGGSKKSGISEFHYPLSSGLSLNGKMSWTGDAPKGVTLNDNHYGTSSDTPFSWPDTWLYLSTTNTYILNIPLKGTFKDLSVLNTLISKIKIHTYDHTTILTFSQGAILVNNFVSIAQGTDDQLNFIRQVWQNLGSTFVDATLLSRSGAPLVDTNGHAIDWFALLSAGNSPLIDKVGLVTDASTQSAIATVVNIQSLSDEDKRQAVTTLTNTLNQAQKTQQGVAVSLLAQTLNVSQSLPALLLRWCGKNIYQWLSATWALKETVETAADIPADYLGLLREVVRRSLLTQQFTLSPAMVQTLLDYPFWFGASAETVTDINLWMLYTLSRYSDLLFQVGKAGGGLEDDVLAYLRTANAAASLSQADAAQTLATLLGWEANELQAAWSVLGGIAKTTPQLDTLLRLQQVQNQTGLGVTQQQQGYLLSRGSDYTLWQSIGQALVAGVSHVKGSN